MQTIIKSKQFTRPKYGKFARQLHSYSRKGTPLGRVVCDPRTNSGKDYLALRLFVRLHP